VQAMIMMFIGGGGITVSMHKSVDQTWAFGSKTGEGTVASSQRPSHDCVHVPRRSPSFSSDFANW
jgi:hypothetical protein